MLLWTFRSISWSGYICLWRSGRSNRLVLTIANGILDIRNGGALNLTDPFAASSTGQVQAEGIQIGRESTGNGYVRLRNSSLTVDSVGALA
jgi:hypothetical protein